MLRASVIMYRYYKYYFEKLLVNFLLALSLALTVLDIHALSRPVEHYNCNVQTIYFISSSSVVLSLLSLSSCIGLLKICLHFLSIDLFTTYFCALSMASRCPLSVCLTMLSSFH